MLVCVLTIGSVARSIFTGPRVNDGIQVWTLVSISRLQWPPASQPGCLILANLVLNLAAKESTGLFRKYIGMLDVAASFWNAARKDNSVLVVCIDLCAQWTAMARHRSQFVWWVGRGWSMSIWFAAIWWQSKADLDWTSWRYRRLFVVFSRYTYMNTLTRVRWLSETMSKCSSTRTQVLQPEYDQ